MGFPIDHDLHTHTVLSSCSADPEQTAQRLLTHAKENGYTVQCVTDHLWDALVPGASDWYAPQDIEHVKKNLPLPKDDQVRMVFGCETEFCGGKKLGLHPSHYDDFDFIVIPPNHFHMKDFVRPSSYDTEEKVADLLVERLEELLELDLPWRKVGIAHLNCSLTFTEGDCNRVFHLADEKRFRAAMRRFAEKGAGIELNVYSFALAKPGSDEDQYRMFRFAKEEGCKFYLATDAHHPNELDVIPNHAAEVIEKLGLTEKDLYRIPE